VETKEGEGSEFIIQVSFSNGSGSKNTKFYLWEKLLYSCSACRWLVFVMVRVPSQTSCVLVTWHFKIRLACP